MRKIPQQQRSRRTVDALIEATALLIAERGEERLTTNHVAARAGVSIGSLYQYFGDKAALFAAVRGRAVGTQSERFESQSAVQS